MVGEGEDFPGGFAFGHIGVGVDHFGGGVVLGEEGQHASGGLGAFGDVVVLERGLFAVVADGVEVEVEPGVTSGESEGAEAADQLAERGGVHLTAHPVGVAGRVGGFGQHVQPDGQAEGAIRGQFGGVGDPVAPQQLQAEQGGHRVPGREAAGGGVAAGGDDLGQAELDHGGKQHEQPGVVALDAGAGWPLEERGGPDGLGPGGGAVATPGPGGQPGQALLGEDHPHRLVADRCPFGGECLGDLFDRAVLGSQVEHPVAKRRGLAGPFGPGLGGHEELTPPGAQLGGHLVHGRLGVAEACPGDLGRLAVDQVGPQRFVAALGGLVGAGEVLRSRSH